MSVPGDFIVEHILPTCMNDDAHEKKQLAENLMILCSQENGVYDNKKECVLQNIAKCAISVRL